MTNKCKDSPRPPLEPSKLNKLERLVRKKTGVSKKVFNKTLENLQKVIKRKKSQNETLETLLISSSCVNI